MTLYVHFNNKRGGEDQMEKKEVFDRRYDVAGVAFFGTLPAAPTLNAEN